MQQITTSTDHELTMTAEGPFSFSNAAMASPPHGKLAIPET